MSLRVRLVLAFLLLSVVPLGAVTAFTYIGNARAIRDGAEAEAAMLATDLSRRMRGATFQLGDRVQQLMNVPAPPATAAAGAAVVTAPAAADEALVDREVAQALGDIALLLENIELRGLRQRPRNRGPGNGPQEGERAVPPAEVRGSDPIRIDMASVRRDLIREYVPLEEWDRLGPDARRRIWNEVDQRVRGIAEGIGMGAAEVRKRIADAQLAAETRARESENDAAAASAVTPPLAPAAESAVPLRRTTSLSGSRLNVTVERGGEVLRQADADLNLPNLLASVFTTSRRGRDEVAFAVTPSGTVFTQSEDQRQQLAELGGDVTRPEAPAGTTMLPGWIVVTTADPAVSDLKFGIARPVGEPLRELRRTTARNAGFGLACIGLALIGILPLSGRLTRNLTTLGEGVGRIAGGDYRTRVEVRSRDEIGRLAEGVNRMAEEVERHQRLAVVQERIRRELELGRQIQFELLPQAPLRLAAIEIQGVSVPAREVGGDYFNYFPIAHGRIALLVGDVSGKGVGAALLMANLQASLRTRLGLGQDLAVLAGELDAELEATTPGPVYTTLFVALFDPATRQLSYVSAGHNPQYVLRRSGGLERMEASGLPVGLLAGHGYSTRQVSLAPGDFLFCYTDGCVEAEDPAGAMFGADRLEALLNESVPGGTDALLTRVDLAIGRFRGTCELGDDATMLAVRIG